MTNGVYIGDINFSIYFHTDNVHYYKNNNILQS